MRRRLLALCCATALLTGCAGDDVTEGEGPLAAPTTLAVDGEELVLNTYAWRDQMPTVGSEPGPCSALCVNGTLEERSGAALPEDLEVVDVVALVEGERTPFDEVELTGQLGPSAYEFVVRGGPVLEPGTTFDLAVLVAVDGQERWLRASDVQVQRTS